MNRFLRKALPLVLACASPAAAGDPQHRAEVYVTARDTGERLAKREPVSFSTLAQPDEHDPTILVDRSRTFQTLEGIGGALTDAAAETYAKLPAERQNELLKAYYDPEAGIGYSLARTHIHSCDFSSESYAYVEKAGSGYREIPVAWNPVL